jgi:hypothetical protein
MPCRSFYLAAVAIFILATSSAEAAQPKRVLLIHSFGPEFAPCNYFSSLFRTPTLGRNCRGKSISTKFPYRWRGPLDRARGCVLSRLPEA